MKQVCFSNQIFSSGNISLVSRTSFSSTSPFFNSTQNSSHQTQTFLHWTLQDIDKPHHDLHFTHHSKLMKMNLVWIETYFFMNQHGNINLCIHAANLRILDQKFIFAHEIHCLAHRTNMSVLASNHPIFSQNLVIMSKTSQNSHLRFWIVSVAFNFRAISLWLFTYLDQ